MNAPFLLSEVWIPPTVGDLPPAPVPVDLDEVAGDE